MRRILIIEDLESDFQLLERQLRLARAQVQCHQVRSNAELASALQHEAWDVVLIDYNVPGMDFSGSLAQVRQQLPLAPVILVSGYLNEELAVEWLRQGVTDFVLKDRLSRLGPAIQRSLDDSRDRQPASAPSRRCATARHAFAPSSTASVMQPCSPTRRVGS
jgi:DNA-binding NtrC family response regulator